MAQGVQSCCNRPNWAENCAAARKNVSMSVGGRPESGVWELKWENVF